MTPAVVLGCDRRLRPLVAMTYTLPVEPVWAGVGVAVAGTVEATGVVVADVGVGVVVVTGLVADRNCAATKPTLASSVRTFCQVIPPASGPCGPPVSATCAPKGSTTITVEVATPCDRRLSPFAEFT